MDALVKADQLNLQQQEAALKEQLYGAQAKHLDAQSKLIDMEMQNQLTMRGLMGQEQQQGQLRGYMTQHPEQDQAPAYEQEPGFVGPPRVGTALAQPEMAGMVNLQQALASIPPKPIPMMRLAQLASASNLHKEAKAYQDAALESQKTQLLVRKQELQDKLGQLTAELESYPEGDASSAAPRLKKLGEMAQVLAALGDATNALKLVQGTFHTLDETQRGVRVSPAGEATTVMEPQKTKAQQAYDLKTVQNQADLGEPFQEPGQTPQAGARPTAPAAPGVTQAPLRQNLQGAGATPDQATLIQMETHLIEAGMPVEEAKRNAPLVLKAMSLGPGPQAPGAPAPAAPQPGGSFIEKKERLQQQTQQNVQAGKAGATAGDVEAEKKRKELNMRFYGTPEPPPGKDQATEAMVHAASEQEQQNVRAGAKGATVEDVQAKRTAGEGLPVEVQTKLSSLNAADHYRQKLEEFSDEEINKYVGSLRGKKADIDNLMANLADATKGDPRRYEFLSLVNQIFYEANRPDTGANFSGIEKELVNQIYAHGGERSSSEFRGKLGRLKDIIATKKATIEGAATTTRGELKRKNTAPASQGSAAPTNDLDAVRQRLRKEGLVK
jgi:hypothetical protein